ncbi:hypothetical protein C8Q77DRAFT_569571 [Trametes polyzona]|nr:hypothetical protein C8Q77DRAFT_569571 [Trametes polyzona]
MATFVLSSRAGMMVTMNKLKLYGSAGAAYLSDLRLRARDVIYVPDLASLRHPCASLHLRMDSMASHVVITHACTSVCQLQAMVRVRATLTSSWLPAAMTKGMRGNARSACEPTGTCRTHRATGELACLSTTPTTIAADERCSGDIRR